MTRNEIIFYVGAGIVVLVGEIGNQYGAGCLSFPLLIVLGILVLFVFPLDAKG